MKSRIQQQGFTLIELVITIALLGIILIPLGLISLEFMWGIVHSRDSGIAQGLAKIEMAKINNLIIDNPSDPTLAVGYDNITTNYDGLGYPYGVRRSISNGPVANLKQIQVRVYPSSDTSQNFLVNLITYLADIPFGAGSGTGAAGAIAANALVVSGGNISGENLRNVTLQNVDPTNTITITGVIVSFKGASGIKFRRITFNKAEGWSGNASSPATVNFNPSSKYFNLAANTTYPNSLRLKFNKRLKQITSLIFMMSDGFQSVDYSW